MTTKTIVPDLTIRYTAHDHVAAYTRLLHEAEWQAAQARTDHERMTWLLWKDNAERGLLRWQGIVQRQTNAR